MRRSDFTSQHPEGVRLSQAIQRNGEVLGFVLGGVPISLYLVSLGGRIQSPEVLRALLFLTPVAILVVAVATALGPRATLWAMLIRSVRTAFAACLPAESLAYLVAAWNLWGRDLFRPENLPFVVLILGAWTLVVSLAGWVCVTVVFAFRDVH